MTKEYFVTLDEDSMCVIEAEDQEEAVALAFKVYGDDWIWLHPAWEWEMFTARENPYREVARIRKCTDEGFSVVVNLHNHEHVTCPRSKDCTCQEDTES